MQTALPNLNLYINDEDLLEAKNSNINFIILSLGNVSTIELSGIKEKINMINLNVDSYLLI